MYKKLMQLFVFISLGLAFTACAPFTGGSCKYTNIETMATVSNIGENTLTVRVNSSASIDGPEYYDIVKTQALDNIVMGDELTIELSQIISGACTPYQILSVQKM
jgi:hypothetical protein